MLACASLSKRSSGGTTLRTVCQSGLGAYFVMHAGRPLEVRLRASAAEMRAHETDK